MSYRFKKIIDKIERDESVRKTVNDFEWRVPVHPRKINQLSNGLWLDAGALLREINDQNIPLKREIWNIIHLREPLSRCPRSSPKYAEQISKTEARKPIILTSIEHAYCPEIQDTIKLTELNLPEHAQRATHRYPALEIIDGACRLERLIADGVATARVIILNGSDTRPYILSMPDAPVERRRSNPPLATEAEREYRLRKHNSVLLRSALCRTGAEEGGHVAKFLISWKVEIAPNGGQPQHTERTIRMKDAVLLQELRLFAAYELVKETDAADKILPKSADVITSREADWREAVSRSRGCGGAEGLRSEFKRTIEAQKLSQEQIRADILHLCETLEALRMGFSQSKRIESASRMLNECVRRRSKLIIGNLSAEIFRKRERHNASYLRIDSLFFASIYSEINQSDIFSDFMMYRTLFDLGIFFSLTRQGRVPDLTLAIAETIIERILIDLSGDRDSLSGLYESAFNLVDENTFVDIFDRAVTSIQAAIGTRSGAAAA